MNNLKFIILYLILFCNVSYSQSGTNYISHFLNSRPDILYPANAETYAKSEKGQFKPIYNDDKSFNGVDYKIRTYDIGNNRIPITSSPTVKIICLYSKGEGTNQWQCIAARAYNQISGGFISQQTASRLIQLLNYPSQNNQINEREWTIFDRGLVTGNPKWAVFYSQNKEFVIFTKLDEHFSNVPQIAIADAYDLFKVLIDKPISLKSTTSSSLSTDTKSRVEKSDSENKINSPKIDIDSIYK